MVINHKHRFIFFHIPKCGGSSVREFLLKIDGSEKGPKTHITPGHFFAFEENAHLGGYSKFVIAREPKDRMEAMYRHMLNKIQRKEPVMSFSEWIIDACTDKPGGLRFPSPVMVSQSAYFGPDIRRLEFSDLENAVRGFLDNVGATPVGDFPHINKGRETECEWTPGALKCFRRKYAADIENHGQA